MSDDIEFIIKRDLDRVPVLPPERWVPAARSPQFRLPTLVVRAGVLIAVLLLGLAVGSTLSYIRVEVNDAASASARPSATSQMLVSRQSVLANIRGLTLIVPRMQRFEAKLMRASDLGSNPQLNPVGVPAASRLPTPGGTFLWVVAVGGDVICNFCVLPPAEPLHSAVFWFDAQSGKVLGSAQGPAKWPEGFDALPDRSIASDSRTLIGRIVTVNGDVVEFQEEGAAARLHLRADENTAYAWMAGPDSGNAVYFADLPPRTDALVRVTYDQLAAPNGDHRLEQLITGWNVH